MTSRKTLPGAGATIELATKVGSITVLVDALDRGLAVHPRLNGDGFALTHAPSGRKLAHFGKRSEALRAMSRVLPMAAWERPWEDVSAMNRATKSKVLSCLARHGGKRDE